MSHTVSFPPIFASRMKNQLKDDWSAFEHTHTLPSPVSVRLHPEKPSFIESNKNVPWSSWGKYLDSRPVFTLDPTFHAGSYYVQEASSMFLEHAVRSSISINAETKVLDLCAAPGGKSTLLLSIMNRDGLLVSNEVIRSRASILAENVQKWGYANTIVTNNDPKDFERLEGFFDLVVVDAPCSGEGLFRKDHEAMHEWSPDNVALCSSRQKRILSDVWPALKENGILIYCTCTYNESENEENLVWLKKEYDVEFIELKIENDWQIVKANIDGVTGYRFFPHKVSGEGFFISIIRKRSPQSQSRHRFKNSPSIPSKNHISLLNDYILNSETFQFQNHQDYIYFIPEHLKNDYHIIHQNLKIVTTGTTAATTKHDKLIPDHALALSIQLNKNQFQKIEVSLDEAIKYLRKEALQIEGFARGFSIITYKHISLGWVNVLDNRMNNLYPSEWRIRMHT